MEPIDLTSSERTTQLNILPMDRKIKSILNVVVIIAVVLWLLSVFGIFDSNIRIGN